LRPVRMANRREGRREARGEGLCSRGRRVRAVAAVPCTAELPGPRVGRARRSWTSMSECGPWSSREVACTAEVAWGLRIMAPEHSAPLAQTLRGLGGEDPACLRGWRVCRSMEGEVEGGERREG
jgi:hypothetical protein